MSSSSLIALRVALLGKESRCRNCAPAPDVLVSLDAPGTRLEILSGDFLKLRFPEDLKTALPHLAGADFEANALYVPSVRADLTPGLGQAPRLSAPFGQTGIPAPYANPEGLFLLTYTPSAMFVVSSIPSPFRSAGL